MAVQGNLDPLSLISGGEAMLRDIDYILESFHDRPHIFNLGPWYHSTNASGKCSNMIDHIRNS